MILPELMALILSVDAITSLVGQRFYRTRLQQGSTLPAMVVMSVGGSSEPTMDGAGVLAVRLQFDVYASDPQQADVLTKALFDLLDPYEGTLGGGTRVVYCEYLGVQDLSENKPTDYWASVEYRVRYVPGQSVDVITPPAEESYSVTLTATETISAYTAVSAAVSGVRWADSADVTKPAIGIASAGALTNAPVPVQYAGPLTYNGWNWALGVPVFVGPNGVLTQTQPTSGYIQAVGMPLSPTTLLIDLEEAVPIT